MEGDPQRTLFALDRRHPTGDVDERLALLAVVVDHVDLAGAFEHEPAAVARRCREVDGFFEPAGDGLEPDRRPARHHRPLLSNGRRGAGADLAETTGDTGERAGGDRSEQATAGGSRFWRGGITAAVCVHREM